MVLHPASRPANEHDPTHTNDRAPDGRGMGQPGTTVVHGSGPVVSIVTGPRPHPTFESGGGVGGVGERESAQPLSWIATVRSSAQRGKCRILATRASATQRVNTAPRLVAPLVAARSRVPQRRRAASSIDDGVSIVLDDEIGARVAVGAGVPHRAAARVVNNEIAI